MLSKSQISFIQSLHQKKERRKEQLFIAEGEKIADELLASSIRVKKIYATPEYPELKRSEKNNPSAEWQEVTEQELKKN